MASTYSSLKIQLMATGENSGTWGTVTNTNLGTAIEEAIVGSVDVSFSNADVTLTLTDTNATQSARNLRLNLTGTVASPQSLIVPAIEKIYIINNGLSQTITVKNSTGTGIAVPAGKTLYVYNDATNVVDAITHLTSLTLATALPVASGGTGSNTATFSGANITSLNADNISTGTLAVARGGTGSGTATFSGANITSLNANNISSGTLAVGQGGTGATTLTLNNVILGNTTSAVKLVAPGTSGNVLTSDGTIWASQAAGGGFASGTVMLFAQTAAPTGWTKNTSTGDNSALRVVTGSASSGGTVNFTTAFASQTPSITVSAVSGSAGNTTLTTPQIPSHRHNIRTKPGYAGTSNTISNNTLANAIATANNGDPVLITFTGNPAPRTSNDAWIEDTGGGGAHSHPFSFSSATASSSAIDLAVKYVDVIRASKD